MRTLQSRIAAVLVTAVLAASGVSLLPGADNAAALPSPTVVGQPCALGAGITIVADFEGVDGRNEIALGCQPVADGATPTAMDATLTAMEAAGGYAVETLYGGGFLCKIDGVPNVSSCLYDGFWSLWNTSGDEWTFSPLGAGSLRPAVDSIVGWSWSAIATEPDENGEYPNSTPRLTPSQIEALRPGAPTTEPTTEPSITPTEPSETTDPSATPEPTASPSAPSEPTPSPTETTAPTDPNSPAVPPAAYGPSTNRNALDGASYIAKRLRASLDAGTSISGGTLDATMALTAVGVGQDLVGEAMGRLRADSSYVYGGSTPSYSAMTKVVLALEIQGIDPRTFYSGHDMVAELRSAVGTDGRISGTNTFSQSLGVMALARTQGGAPTSAVDWLRTVQCTDSSNANYGGYGYSANCRSVDSDYTALVAQAMHAAGVPSTDFALTGPASYLSRTQTSDGGWLPGFGGAANTNSAGLSVQFLATQGNSTAVASGRSFIDSVQVSCEDLSAIGYKDIDLGAIAYTKSAFDAGAAGTTSASSGQFYMASSQAVLAFANRDFGSMTSGGASTDVPTPSCAPDPEPTDPNSSANNPVPYGPSINSNALAAATWISNELTRNNYTMPGFMGTDWGLTLDATLALAAVGVSQDVSDHVMDALRADDSYVYGWGETSIPSMAKVVYAVDVQGLDPRTFYPGHDMVAELRASILPSGQFKDSNAFSQSLAILSLVRTAGGAPAEATAYLKSLQCATPNDPNYGGFGYSSSCSSVDADYTSMAAQALMASGSDATSQEVSRAADYLVRTQASDGGWVPGFSGPENTNSAGLAAQLLNNTNTSAAAKAQSFVAALQAGCSDVSATGFTAADIGAIAYSRESFDDAAASGMALNADQFRRASSQAVLAFAGRDFGSLTTAGAAADVPTQSCDPSNVPVNPAAYGATSDALSADAASWIGRQLIASNGLLDNYGSPDWGITLDAVTALAAAGAGHDASATAIDRFRAEGASWIDGAWPAGSLSRLTKATYVLLVQGEDPRTFFPGRDLLAEIRAAGVEGAGHFGDQTDVIGQAYGVLALARTQGGVPADAVTWLSAQQCETGGFGWDLADRCGSVDADSSSIAGQALVAAGASPSGTVLSALKTWLAGNQGADGAFSNSAAAWGAPNAQSSGLAGQTARALGMTASADRAHSFVRSMWITSEVVAAHSVLALNDQGAIAWDQETLDQATTSGLSGGTLDSIRWTTMQGFFADTRSLGAITATGAIAGLPVTPKAPVGPTTPPTTHPTTPPTTPPTVAPSTPNPGSGIDAGGTDGAGNGTTDTSGVAVTGPLSDVGRSAGGSTVGGKDGDGGDGADAEVTEAPTEEPSPSAEPTSDATPTPEPSALAAMGAGAGSDKGGDIAASGASPDGGISTPLLIGILVLCALAGFGAVVLVNRGRLGSVGTGAAAGGGPGSGAASSSATAKGNR